MELVAAWLAVHKESSSYAKLADGLGLDDLESFGSDDAIELRRHHERRLTAVLGPVLASLQPAERRALEYAALLPADYVALPWLKELVTRDFPELAQAGKRSDPWLALVERLTRLALFTRAEGETTEPRVVRVHRLVQELVRLNRPEPEKAARQTGIDELIAQRIAVLEKVTNWVEARWELEPLSALAGLWDEMKHPQTSWLLAAAGERWHQLAEWSRAEPLMPRALAIDEGSSGPDDPEVATDLNNLARLLQATNRLGEAEPLMRRALAIDEGSSGPDHPNVAIRLNNLAQLLRATNRLGEAEPLMRRHLEIFLKFTVSTGHQHPHLQGAVGNYARLLSEMGRSQPEVLAELNAIGKPFGMEFG